MSSTIENKPVVDGWQMIPFGDGQEVREKAHEVMERRPSSLYYEEEVKNLIKGLGCLFQARVNREEKLIGFITYNKDNKNTSTITSLFTCVEKIEAGKTMIPMLGKEIGPVSLDLHLKPNPPSDQKWFQRMMEFLNEAVEISNKQL